jgi:hypothetical protein
MSIAGARPEVIGCYVIDGKARFYGVLYAELERQSVGLANVLRTFGFAPGSVILTISLVHEVVQFAGFEKAIQMIGLYGTNSELSLYDCGRIESISRQLNPVAICGVGLPTLEGLHAAGYDAARVFAGRTVWARSDAYEAVKAIPGVDARRLVVLGPTIALECAHGGVHYDTRDWNLESKGGTLHVSSRMPRVEPVSDLNTEVVGRVAVDACSCGVQEGCIEVGGAR